MEESNTKEGSYTIKAPDLSDTEMIRQIEAQGYRFSYTDLEGNEHGTDGKAICSAWKSANQCGQANSVVVLYAMMMEALKQEANH